MRPFLTTVLLLIASTVSAHEFCPSCGKCHRCGTAGSVIGAAWNAVSNTAQAVAQERANRMAARGIIGHVSGSYAVGGASAEGVGFSTSSAQDAINHCCFTGNRGTQGGYRPAVAIATARGRNGWYAVRLAR